MCASVALAALAYASAIVGRDGLSYFYVENSVSSASQVLADKAIQLNPANPDAFQARAALFQKEDQIDRAIEDLNRAVALRPGDHFLWLERGYCRYLTHDLKGAIADFRISASLAPAYAQPRWYLGNLLLEAGKTDEGFDQIRRAVASGQGYLPEAILLAADIYHGNPQAIRDAIRPQSSANRLALAQYFISHEAVSMAMELFAEAGANIDSADRKILINNLVAAKRFSEAYQLWLVDQPRKDKGSAQALINDAGFEADPEVGPPNFAWRISPTLQRVSLSREEGGRQPDSFSLRVDFNGISPVDTPLLSQILMVDPAVQYRLDFDYRSRQLVTGGPPIVAIIDSNDGQVLARSNPIPENHPEWSQESIDFSPGAATRAVTIMIKRSACSTTPCPAFGHAWFGNFMLTRN